MCCDIWDCADHTWQTSIFLQFGLWVSDGAGNVEIAREHAHLSKEFDVVNAAFLLPVYFATMFYYS